MLIIDNNIMCQINHLQLIKSGGHCKLIVSRKETKVEYVSRRSVDCQRPEPSNNTNRGRTFIIVITSEIILIGFLSRPCL